MARGWLTVTSRRMDEFLNSVLTTQLFVTNGGPGMDLASLNIQRGRDHGLPPYESWRDFCENTFRNLPRAVFENRLTLRRFLTLHGDPGFAELWIAGLAEERLPDSLLGVTFACIFGLTFKNVRDGDRFYYESEGVFTDAQLEAIEDVTFSRVICDNTDSTRIQTNAFRTDFTERVRCDDTDSLPALNLSPWSDDSGCLVRIDAPAPPSRVTAVYSRVGSRRGNLFSNFRPITPECFPIECPTRRFPSTIFAFITPRASCTINGLPRRVFREKLSIGDSRIFSSVSACQQATQPLATFKCSSLADSASDDSQENDPESGNFKGDIPEELKEELDRERTELFQQVNINEASNDKELLPAEIQDKDLLSELEEVMKKLD